MMGFSCDVKAVYVYTPCVLGRKKYYHCTRHSDASFTGKPASQQERNAIKKYSKSDTIRRQVLPIYLFPMILLGSCFLPCGWF